MCPEPANPNETMGEEGTRTPNIKLILAKANIFYRNGKLNEALQQYDRASILQPANPHIWTAKGRLLADLRRYKDAAASFSRSLSIINKGRFKIDIPMEGQERPAPGPQAKPPTQKKTKMPVAAPVPKSTSVEDIPIPEDIYADVRLPSDVTRKLDELEKYLEEEDVSEDKRHESAMVTSPPSILKREKRSLVNGIPPLKTKGPKRGFRRPVRKMRFVAVVIIVILVAITGVLSVVLFPMGKGIVIDGKFDDWKDVPHIQMQAGAVDPNVDVRSVGYVSTANYLYVHVVVAGKVFAGEPQPSEPGKADTLPIFIDSDGDRNSGYDMDGFGADRLVRIYGRFGEVKNAQLFEFPASGDRDNLSAFKLVGSVPAGSSGSEVETQVGSAGFSSGFGIYPEMKAYNGDEDFADYPIGIGRSSVSVTETAPSGQTYQAKDDTTLLTVDLRPHGSVQALKLNVHTTLSKLRTTGGEVQASGGVATIDVGTVSADAKVEIKGDLGSTASGSVAGAWLDSASDIGADALIKLNSSGARNARKYVASPPSGITIDGAFGDWTNKKDDPADLRYKNIDLQKYAAERKTSTVYFYGDVIGRMMGGMVVPFNAPVVIAAPPKPGNGSGLPPNLPRADGMDTFYAFVDTDQNRGTGFQIGEVGAEYAAIISGKHGKVLFEGLYHYSGKWVNESGISVRNDYGQIEGSMTIPGVNGSVKVLFMLESWDGKYQDISNGAITVFSRLPSQKIVLGMDGGPEPNAISRDFSITSARWYNTLGTQSIVTSVLYSAQSFIAPFDFVMTRTSARLCDSGSLSNTVTAEIRTDDGSGLPSSTIAITNNLPALSPGSCSSPPTNYLWTNIDWSQRIYIKGGTRVWLVLRSDAAGVSEGIYWTRWTSLGDAYANGYLANSTDSGSSWTQWSGYDVSFFIYGTEVSEYEDNVEGWGRSSRYDVAPVAVTIGIGTAGQYQEAPLDIYYNYHRSQMIYLASEVGGAGTITAIAFDRAVLEQDTINNLNIWMGHTSLSAYASATPEPEGFSVWSGNMVVPMWGTRWYQIHLQTPFQYNGVDNLLISIRHQDGSYEDPARSVYNYTSTSPDYRFITGSSDSVDPPALGMSYNRPNIKIIKGAWVRGVPSGLGPGSDHTRGANTYAWCTICSGNYPDSASTTLTTNYIDLALNTQPVLSFWHYYDTGVAGIDGGRVLVSTDGTTFTPIAPVGGYPPPPCTALGGAACFSGASAGWRRVVFDLTSPTDLRGNSVRFKFEFASDASGNAPGWYIDDIKVGYPVQIDEVWSYGWMSSEKLILYNYGPSAVTITNWQVTSSIGPFSIPAASIASGSTYTLTSGFLEDRYVDAGDYIRLSDNSALRSISGTTYSTTTRVDVDYMRYGSSVGIDSQLWGLLWTQSSALPAPASSSQYLKRDTEGSFASVDTGDAGDWGIIPEMAIGTTSWLAIIASISSILIIEKRIRTKVQKPCHK